MSAIPEAFEKICKRWGVRIVGLDKDDQARCIGISVGLGELFDDKVTAEVIAMTKPHKRFGGKSPLRYIEDGGVPQDVLDWVDEMRELR